MKRFYVAAAALALMSGAAYAQTKTQPADATDAQKKGGIVQPSGVGANEAMKPGSASDAQPADGTDAQKKGGIAQPSGEGGTVTK
jgi:hypothetical protein